MAASCASSSSCCVVLPQLLSYFKHPCVKKLKASDSESIRVRSHIHSDQGIHSRTPNIHPTLNSRSTNSSTPNTHPHPTPNSRSNTRRSSRSSTSSSTPNTNNPHPKEIQSERRISHLHTDLTSDLHQHRFLRAQHQQEQVLNARADP